MYDLETGDVRFSGRASLVASFAGNRILFPVGYGDSTMFAILSLLHSCEWA